MRGPGVSLGGLAPGEGGLGMGLGLAPEGGRGGARGLDEILWAAPRMVLSLWWYLGVKGWAGEV